MEFPDRESAKTEKHVIRSNNGNAPFINGAFPSVLPHPSPPRAETKL